MPASLSRTRGLRVLACEQGMAALEFALIALALLMLVFAIIIYSL
jgi:Flp pilus assembly protein TadG